MKTVAGVSLTVVGIVAVVLLFGALDCRFDPVCRAEQAHQADLRIAQADALAPLNLWVGRILRIALIVVLASAALSALAFALASWRYLPARGRNAAAVYWPRFGMQPVLVQPELPAQPNLLLGRVAPQSGLRVSASAEDAQARIARAVFAGAEQAGSDGPRITSPVMRQLLRPEPETALLPEPEPAQVLLPAEQVVDVDPVTRPHWLVVGQTGSGKSTATRFIMRELAARNRVEFLICEPGGVDWNTLASATTETDIAECIDVTWRELERRQELLRAEDVPHVTALREQLPYLYLVVEEAESILDNLRDLSRANATSAKIALRNIARLGRKTGIGLIMVTQAARTDVFDSHVRTNLANILLFRNSQTTAEMFRLRVRLTDLPTGQAYSVAHGSMIAFPRTERPVVPVSTLYRGSGIPQEWVVGDAEMVSAPSTVSVPVPDGDPEEWLVERIWAAYQAHNGNLSAAQRSVFGYDGGRAYYVARFAVQQMRRRV